MLLGVVYTPPPGHLIGGLYVGSWLAFTETNSTMPDVIVNVLAVTTGP